MDMCTYVSTYYLLLTTTQQLSEALPERPSLSEAPSASDSGWHQQEPQEAT